MDVATISILVVIVGCVVALAEWIRSVKNDSGMMAAEIRTLKTKLEHFEEELDELRADEMAIEATVHKAMEERIINEKTVAVLQEKLEKQQQ